MSGKGELAKWVAKTIANATTKSKPAPAAASGAKAKPAAGAASGAKAKPAAGAAAGKAKGGSGSGPPGGPGVLGGTTPPFIPPNAVKWAAGGLGGYLAASTAMAILFDDDDTPAKPQQWDAPDGSKTHILPASAASIEGVAKADSDLRTTQQKLFSFRDGPNGTVWGDNPPAPIAIAGATETALTPFTQRSADLASAVTQILQSDEPYVQRMKGQLTSSIDAIAKQPSEAAALVTEVKNVDSAAAKSYDAFREANRSYRANLVADGKIGDSSTTSTLASAIQQNNAAVDAADGKIAGLFPAPAATTVSTTTTGGGTPTPAPKPNTPGTPTPGAPAAVTPGGKPTETPKPTDTKPTENKDLKDLISKLGNGNNGNPLGGGNPLGSGTGSPLGGGGTPLGGGSSTPLGGDKPKLEDKKSEEKKKDDEKPKLEDRKDKKRDLAGAKPLQDKAEVKPPADKKPEAAAAAPAGVPAGPPPAGNPQPNPATGQGKPQSTEVDVKGTKVDMKDPKLAKLAETLAAADPTHPVSLAEAAQKAGLTPPVPGQDPGKQVSPSDAKPGNLLIAGEREYLLLEDGKFYDLKDFKVVSADQIPGELGRGGGYFALNDPSPGQPVPGDPNAAAQPGGQPGQPGTPPPGGQPQGPVSPVSTSGVQQPVPGSPTGAPVGPVDPAAKPGSSSGATPAPPSNDGTGSGGGVPVSGSPGQPAEGKPSDAPGGAAGTATAGGATGPSLGGRSMDPGSVQ